MPTDDKIKQLRELVNLFSRNIAQYKSGQYNEASTHLDFIRGEGLLRSNKPETNSSGERKNPVALQWGFFIDKFFELLDWDVTNKKGYKESYRDVVVEDKVKIDGTQKAPDYSFRIGGVRKFFVEAKKPSVNIKEAAEPAYQVRRYAYTAKLPISILTNFAEFAIYDTRIKPNKDDKAGKERIFYCTFDKYEENFDFLFNTLNQEAIQKGSLDDFIEDKGSRKATSEVDTELLSLIEDWRVELAKNIAKNNPDLSIINLNIVVQRIIDRIIFLRIAEDRGIEDENLLITEANTGNIYEKLVHIFSRADQKYNSGLFLKTDWINKVKIEDAVLRDIITNLYYPECPYEFSVLPIEILGSIYERFLGKTIKFRGIKGDTHTAIIEDKPEVKKAGGVYYTPQYIVEYIVHNTLGEKIKNLPTGRQTPDEIAELKICDPACGSGSFLVNAYQYLLNYHLDYYSQDKNKKSALTKAKIYEAGFQSYKLTIEEKQRILTNNIYGVDIDLQAAEVTKLSLYLKLLEDESKQYREQLFKYSDNALLPSLENNIKCGNSLIGKDFYSQGNLELTDDDRIKVNCFDWNGKNGFAEIFKGGGFDVVIGNPPYCNYSARNSLFAYYEKNGMKNEYDFLAKVNSYCKERYRDSSSGVTDIYKWFIQKATELINEKGCIGFIIPDTFEKLESYNDVRTLLKEKYSFKPYGFNVFQGATVSSGVLLFPKISEYKKDTKCWNSSKKKPPNKTSS